MAILIAETERKFGYHPATLSFGSGREIVARCDECLTVKIMPIAAYLQDLKTTDAKLRGVYRCRKCSVRHNGFNLSARTRKQPATNKRTPSQERFIGRKPEGSGIDMPDRTPQATKKCPVHGCKEIIFEFERFCARHSQTERLLKGQGLGRAYG